MPCTDCDECHQLVGHCGFPLGQVVRISYLPPSDLARHVQVVKTWGL